MSAVRKLCTFSLGDLFCAVEVERVQEVIRPQEMTRVPLASPAVRGLINLRGQIIPALDLRRRLGMSERPAGPPPMNVVVGTGQEAVSLLVDDVGDVLEADEAAFEHLPETVQGAPRELIRGAYKLPGRLLLLLDMDKALNLSDEGGD